MPEGISAGGLQCLGASVSGDSVPEGLSAWELGWQLVVTCALPFPDQSQRGRTALIVACSRGLGFGRYIKDLLASGANKVATDKVGNYGPLG